MTGPDATNTGTTAPATLVPVAGEVYERQLGRWSRRLAPRFLEFLGDGGEGKRVIDVGCGTGSLTFSLAERHPTATIVGCDIAEPLLAYARATNRLPSGSASSTPMPAPCPTMRQLSIGHCPTSS